MPTEPNLSLLTYAFTLQAPSAAEASSGGNETPLASRDLLSIDPLNRLLRHELAAEAAYQRVLEVVAAPLGAFLTTLLDGHRLRVALLRERLLALGGQPAAGAGAWGVLVHLAEGTASLLGPQMMLGVLEEMEDHGVTDYRQELFNLDDRSRTLVETDLLPAQEHAVAALVDLRSSPSDVA